MRNCILRRMKAPGGWQPYTENHMLRSQERSFRLDGSELADLVTKMDKGFAHFLMERRSLFRSWIWILKVSLLTKNIKPSIIGFQNISEWLYILRLPCKFWNLNLNNVHAQAAESEQDIFYESVDRKLEDCFKYGIKSTLGDLNSQVGMKPTNGLRIIQLVVS